MNSNKRTATAANVDASFQRQTRSKLSVEKGTLDSKMHDAFGLVLHANFLHWSDGVALGGACKEAQTLWKETAEDKYLSPLLQELEGMVGTSSDDEDGYGQILRHELLDGAYPSFSVAKKCDSMVALLQTMVRNMQTFNFCLDDPSNRAKNKECSIIDWCIGDGFELEEDFLHKNDRRSTLATNIAIFDSALSAMKEGGDHYFNDVLLGKKGGFLGGGSCYGHVICHTLSLMLPLRDEDLVKHLRAAYPSSKTLNILGPVLTTKVVLMAPFFRWVPPAVDGDDSDEGVCLEALPTPLEPMNEMIIRASGMEEWLRPHHGIYMDY